MNDAAIQQFVEKHRVWIEKTASRIRKNLMLYPAKRFVSGEQFLYQGRNYPLFIADDMHGKLLFEDRFILNARYHSRARKIFETWYKERAMKLFEARCRFFAAAMGVRPGGLTLTGARSRWGSCSAKGNVRLNWRLVMAPPEVLDYVVVHELAHLKELNHSPRFWRAVEEALPQFRESRRWLKEYAPSLRLG